MLQFSLTLSAPGVFLSDYAPGGKKNAFHMKFGTAILCNVTKKLVEKKFQNCSHRDDDVTNYVNFLENYAKNG